MIIDTEKRGIGMSRCSVRAWVAALLAGGALLTVACTAGAQGAASLPQVNGPRPGPDILYEPPFDAPQLQNTGVWKAPPILVSGASAYRGGEFLYQDFLYDDRGANGGQRDPNDPSAASAGPSADTFSSSNGTYTYPTAPDYAGNAADFVELRVKPLPDATAFRITLNTLKDPSLIGVTIALGTSAAPRFFPFGAQVAAPAAHFLTVHGTTAVLQKADPSFSEITPAPTAAVDLARRQIEVRVPHAAWDPGTSVIRMAAGVGLWDKAANQYLQPQGSADATHPGGAGTLNNPPAFFNVAFRRACTAKSQSDCEPLPDVSQLGSSTNDTAWWRDKQQATSLAAGDLSPFHADVDFGKLAAGTDDDSGVPRTGVLNRILPSHFETEQGVDYSQTCGGVASCKGEYRGRLQPYAIYVPSKPEPAGGYGLTLLLHSLGANYNLFSGSRIQSQFGERGRGSIVITPEGRGTDGWYYDYAGADTFEVWADVAAHYALDPDWTVISGYSMGGYGTYKFATQFPDLFAKGQPVVGPPTLGISTTGQDSTSSPSSSTYFMLPSLRNVPFMIWDATSDELVPFPGVQAQAHHFDELGLRYIFDAFSPAEHLTLAFNDQYDKAAAFLGSTLVNRDPAHVTYVYNPTMDFSAVGTKADHAYWLAGLTLRNGSGSTPRGTIDVRSDAFGRGDPKASGTTGGGGALTGGNVPAIGYAEEAQTWGAAPAAPRRNRLDITAQNIRTVSIDAGRARVGCDATLAVKTDGPLTVTLAGCGRQVPVPTGQTTVRAPCRDRARPSSRIRRARGSRRRLTISGTATDRGCHGGAQGATVHGLVARVRVSVFRKVGRRCRFLSSVGRFTLPRPCTRTSYLTAHGRARWRLAFRGRFRRGTYGVWTRAIDGRGNLERKNRRRNFHRFRVR